jgi:hypothetical protein
MPEARRTDKVFNNIEHKKRKIGEKWPDVDWEDIMDPRMPSPLENQELRG